jgi:hypothetical protein
MRTCLIGHAFLEAVLAAFGITLHAFKIVCGLW